MAKMVMDEDKKCKGTLSFGLQRKKMGKMHKEFYEQRLAKSKEQDAFQRTMMSVIKGLLDVIDANNKKITDDYNETLKKDKNN